MVNLFKTLIGGWAFIKSLDDNGVVVDSEVEKLHYKFTAGALFLSTTLLGLSEIFGKPIQCLSNKEEDDDDKEEQMNKAVTQWCFVQGTYTICTGNTCNHFGRISPAQGKCKSKYINEKNGEDGYDCTEFNSTTGVLARYKQDDCREKDDCVKQHNYYQWVPFLFIFQGLLFILPNTIWIHLEGRKMSSISTAVTTANKKTESERLNVVRNVCRYIDNEAKVSGHKKYAFSFIFYLCLHVLNVIFNIYLLDIFIDGEFLGLGNRWLDASEEEKEILLLRIFPRMTMCQFEYSGTGGGQNLTNYLCILATNNIIEKIFIFLWFWLWFLLIASSLSLIYFSLLLFSYSEDIRVYFLSLAIKVRVSTFRIKSQDENKEKKEIFTYLKILPGSNFFLLYNISKNVDLRFFKDLLKELSAEK